MNALNEAADLLKNSWCKNELVKGDGLDDKFCALGALAAVKMGYSSEMVSDLSDEERTSLDEQIYANDFDWKEIDVLAEVITEQNPDHDYENCYGSTEIIYDFNDSQKSVKPVIAMFEKAAVKFDEIV